MPVYRNLLTKSIKDILQEILDGFNYDAQVAERVQQTTKIINILLEYGADVHMQVQTWVTLLQQI